MSDFDWMNTAQELNKQKRPFCLATIIDSGGATPRDIGTRMIVCSNGEFMGTIGGGNMERQIIAEATELLKSAKLEVKKLSIPLGPKAQQCCGGMVEILLETFNQGPILYIFGAGHVGQAVTSIMHGTGVGIFLWDQRREWIESSQLPIGLAKSSDSYEEVIKQVQNEERHYAIVLTHSHDLDLEIIATLAKRNFAYLGLIGSHNKWVRFSERLKTKGLTEKDLAKIECPMGLPQVRGKLPKEIAISVAGRILTLLYGK
ncbi:MAG: xanthine dehydrogenase accessory protein XdhC [Bdellovibrionota bacterium]